MVRLVRLSAPHPPTAQPDRSQRLRPVSCFRKAVLHCAWPGSAPENGRRPGPYAWLWWPSVRVDQWGCWTNLERRATRMHDALYKLSFVMQKLKAVWSAHGLSRRQTCGRSDSVAPLFASNSNTSASAPRPLACRHSNERIGQFDHHLSSACGKRDRGDRLALAGCTAAQADRGRVATLSRDELRLLVRMAGRQRTP